MIGLVQIMENTQISLSNYSGKKNMFRALISLFVITVLLPSVAASGDNMIEPEWDSDNEQYLVSNLTELNWIRNAPKEDYKLTSDINATPTENWNNGKGWKPIGEQNYEFYGTLNGNNYSINNLTIDRPNTELVGFIAITGSDAIIKDLKVEGLSATGYNYIGGLVGENYGKISNLDYQGSVTLSNYVNYAGGLVGASRGGRIKDINVNVTINQSDDGSGTGEVGGVVGRLDADIVNSSARGKISLSKKQVGGLVGSSDGTIRNSNSSVTVQAESEVGGLVGRNDYGKIVSSYSTGNVTGDEEVGGLVGLNNDDRSSVIENSYSTSKVTGNRSVGGLVGYNNGKIKRSYSTGNVTGDTYAGGLVGWNVGAVESSFWNTQTSTLSDSDGGRGLNTSEMRNFWSFRSSPDIEAEHHEEGEPVGVTLQKGRVRNISLNNEENSFELVEVNESFDHGDEAVIKVNGDNKTITGSTNITVSNVDIGLSHVSDYTDPQEADLQFYLGNMWDVRNISSFENISQSYTWNIVDGESYPFLSWEEVEEGNYSVNIDVVDSSGDSVGNASVQVDYKNKETDRSGEAVFDGLYEAEYTAIADKKGYHKNSVNFKLLSNGQAEAITLEEKSSTFNITELNLSSTQAETGETVDVNVSVENNGSEQGRRILKLTVDGIVEGSSEINLNAGETKNLEFSFSRDTEGDYTIKASLYGDEESESISVGPIEYNLTLNSAEEGSTTPSSGNYTYSEGESVQIDAISNTGWKFDTWKGDVSKNSKTITLTMDEHKELTPVFTGDRDLKLSEVAAPKSVNGEMQFNFEIVNNENEPVSDNVTFEFSGREVTDLKQEITIESNESWSTLENGSTQSFDLIDGDASENAVLNVKYANASAKRSFRIGSIERNFKKGWSYFSLPIATDEEYSIDNVLQEEKINTIWTYENGEWINYYSGAPSNELTSFEGGKGYIVGAKEDFTSRPIVNTNLSRVSSDLVIGPAGTEITSGWNLIGSYWTDGIASNSSGAFSSMPENHISQVLYSDMNGDISLKTLGKGEIKSGRAYWVSAKSNASYTKSR
jgi:hypothetical protein